MPSGPTYNPIQTITLGTNSTSVSFLNIPQTYTDLILICNVNNSSTLADGFIRFNNDSATNYSRTQMYGSGTAASTTNQSNQDGAYLGGYFGNEPTNAIITIYSYTNTNFFKTAIGFANTPNRNTISTVCLWRSTAAITTITFGVNGGNLASNSTFSLYGVTAA